MARRTKEEAEQTKQAILGSALELLYEKGFSRTTFDEVAKRINLTKGAVYWHFRNKADLLAELMRQKHPDLFVVIPTVQTVAPVVCRELENWVVPHVVVSGEEERYHAFAAADVALAASGTVSLELAMAGVKHIIAYRVSPLTAIIVKRLIQIRFVNLINIY